MLVRTLKFNEDIYIGDQIKIVLYKKNKIGIEAPKEINIEIRTRDENDFRTKDKLDEMPEM